MPCCYHMFREFNLIACPDRYARIAQLMGVPTDGLTVTEAAYAAIASDP